MCKAFNCPPGVALHQDPKLVFAVLEARAAVTATDKFNAQQTLTPGENDLLIRMKKRYHGED